MTLKILVKYYIRMSEEIDTDLQLYVCVAMLVLFVDENTINSK